jgi:cell division protein FtsB
VARKRGLGVNKTGVPESSLWLRSLSLDLRFLAVLASIVIGAFMLAPDMQAYLDQRKRIADMEESIRLAEQELATALAERDRWRDPNYIRSQARDRLYYVLPGEVSYLVMNADGFSASDQTGTLGELLEQQRRTDAFSDSLAASDENWVDAVLESVLRSALDKPVGDE